MRFVASLAVSFSGLLITLLNAAQHFTAVISLIGSLLALAGGWYAFRIKRLEWLETQERRKQSQAIGPLQ
jgi:hypothetical protein